MPLLLIADIVSSRVSAQLSRTLQSSLIDRQQELATGRRSDITKFNQGRVGDVQQIQKSINDLSRLQEGIRLAGSELDIVQLSLSGIRRSASGLATNTLASVQTGDQVALQLASAEARGAIEGIFSSLNARANGRFVFSGDDVTTPPVASATTLFSELTDIATSATDGADLTARLDTFFNDPNGGFQQLIYQGGENDASSFAVSENERVGNSIRADSEPIRNAVQGLSTIFLIDQAFQTLPQSQVIDVASSGAGQLFAAEAKLTNEQANIGIDQARIENLSVRYQAEEVILSQSFNDRTSRDPFEVATELRDLEARLETSFLVTARLSELRLTNFLR